MTYAAKVNRYHVGCADRAGCTWVESEHPTLKDAQLGADLVRFERGRDWVVFVTDSEDPERGDLSWEEEGR